jgi:hypothetical protein
MHNRSSEFTVKPQNDFKEITISTWKRVGGVLETWHFRISKTVFDVYNHYIVLYHIGPYN